MIKNEMQFNNVFCLLDLRQIALLISGM